MPSTQIAKSRFLHLAYRSVLSLCFVAQLGHAQASTGTHSIITQKEFDEAVARGLDIRGKSIPSSFIQHAIEISGSLREKNAAAEMSLVDCIIEGDAINPKSLGPEIPIKNEVVKRHFADREAKPAGVWLRLSWQQSSVKAPFYLNNALIAAPMTFTQVEFNNSFYLQGAAIAKNVTFQSTTFKDLADFSATLIIAPVSCDNCQFQKLAAFFLTTITGTGRVYFGGDKLTSPIDFSGSKLDGAITLEGSTRPLEITGPLFFDQINYGQPPTGTIRMKNILLPTVYADNTNLEQLDISEVHNGLHRPIRFSGFADFRGSRFIHFDAAGAEFGNNADFTNAVFIANINLERAKFRQPALLKWYQLETKLHSEAGVRLSNESYEELERNFHTLDDLEGENECKYEKRLNSEGRNVSWLVFGFGVRRRMPFLCLMVLGVLFLLWNSFIVKDAWRLSFSPESLLGIIPLPPAVAVLKATLLKISFPDSYYGTKRGKAIFVLQALMLKLLLALLLITIAHTSPLLKELLPYLGVK